MTPYRGRFAPSPTGLLHLGGASTALCAWLAARAAGGAFLIRIEDLDRPRVVPGAAEAILDDLRWLGLDWDEGPDQGGSAGPYVQSERVHRYERALARLQRDGRTYLCDCSRAEIARIASAPHQGDEGPVYPGTCREAPLDRAFRRPPATRLRVPPGVISFVDRVHGEQQADVSAQTGDFVLRRGDGIFAYQLAVVVDDLEMEITEVVRGADLIGSTARQIAIASMLGGKPPSFAHAPLVLGADGSRLAKRAQGVTVRDHRVAGVSPGRLVALLAGVLGLRTDTETEVHPRDLIASFSWDRVPGEPVCVDAEALRIVDRPAGFSPACRDRAGSS